MTRIPIENRHRGFTLTELVTVMLIIGILTAVGTPTFKYVTASNRIAGEINGLLGDMQFARSQAVKQGLPVTVCIANTTGTACAASGVNTWQNGWIVFNDSDGDHVKAASEAVLRWQPAFNSTDTFTSTPTVYNYTTFNRMGYAPTGSATIINISLHDSTNNIARTRCLAVNPIGSVLTEKYGDQLFGTATTACT